MIITNIALTLAARILLSSSNNAVAVDGKPPFIASAVSYVGYASLWITFAVMLIIAFVKLRKELYSLPDKKGNDSPGAVFDKITSVCLSVFLFSLAGYLLFVLGYTVLSAGGSYFDLIFHNLLPPLGYSSADFGMPMILYTVLTVSLLLLSLTLLFSFAFVFSAGRRHQGRFAVGCMLVFYAVSLSLFIILILSNIPPAELFAGYMHSGSYSNVISAYLAVMIALLVPALISFPFTFLFAAKHRR
ncbi:MAG: hypothetical protein IKU19_04925 [Clostridia bacterium]|nr:hypothetical protein [Clostridia bacterium]